MKETTMMEGYVDLAPGYEFDMDCFMLKPVVQHSTPSNEGGIDEMVEEYALARVEGKSNADLDMREQFDENGLASIQRRFWRLRKTSQQTAYYWRRVIEIDPDSEQIYVLAEPPVNGPLPASIKEISE